MTYVWQCSRPGCLVPLLTIPFSEASLASRIPSIFSASEGPLPLLEVLGSCFGLHFSSVLSQLCVGMYVHVYTRVHVHTCACHSSSGGQKNPREEILSLHCVLESQGLNSKQQAWHQECVLAEPSPWFFVPLIPAVHPQAGFSPTSCHYGDISSSSYLGSFQLPGT